MSVKVRAPIRKKSPVGKYWTRRKPADGAGVNSRIVFVATSTTKASPKLLAMNAIRVPSGDHEARSPNPVSCRMCGGSRSSGLPRFVPCASGRAVAATPISAMASRDASLIGPPSDDDQGRTASSG
jgi:hypothetical protein